MAANTPALAEPRRGTQQIGLPRRHTQRHVIILPHRCAQQRQRHAKNTSLLATSLTAWLRHLALDGDLAKASTKTLRFRLLSAPARLVTHARRRILKIPPGWKWAGDLATAWDRLQALHPI